jgi:cyanophycinase
MSRIMIQGGDQTPLLGEGLGLLPKVIIDTHYLERRRGDRLMKALDAHPGLAGLGLDSGAALVIQRDRATVLGQSRVCFYSSTSESAESAAPLVIGR